MCTFNARCLLCFCIHLGVHVCTCWVCVKCGNGTGVAVLAAAARDAAAVCASGEISQCTCTLSCGFWALHVTVYRQKVGCVQCQAVHQHPSTAGVQAAVVGLAWGLPQCGGCAAAGSLIRPAVPAWCVCFGGSQPVSWVLHCRQLLAPGQLLVSLHYCCLLCVQVLQAACLSGDIANPPRCYVIVHVRTGKCYVQWVARRVPELPVGRLQAVADKCMHHSHQQRVWRQQCTRAFMRWCGREARATKGSLLCVTYVRFHAECILRMLQSMHRVVSSCSSTVA